MAMGKEEHGDICELFFLTIIGSYLPVSLLTYCGTDRGSQPEEAISLLSFKSASVVGLIRG